MVDTVPAAFSLDLSLRPMEVALSTISTVV
jgi:hypothetical protein